MPPVYSGRYFSKIQTKNFQNKNGVKVYRLVTNQFMV